MALNRRTLALMCIVSAVFQRNNLNIKPVLVYGALSPDQTEELVRTADPIGKQQLPSFRVLITAVPYASHALQMVRLGQEIASRGHQVWFGSSDDFVELSYGRQVDFSALNLTWLPLGRPPLNASQRHERDQLAVKQWARNAAAAVRDVLRPLMTEFHLLYCHSLLETHGLGPGSFDVVVTDGVTSCALDYAPYIGAPLVISTSTTLSPLGAGFLRFPPSWHVPAAPVIVPYKMSVAHAVQNIVTVGLVNGLIAPMVTGFLEDCRAAVGLVRQSMRSAFTSTPPPLVLVPSAPGFEPPVSLPPHIHLIGGLIFEPPDALSPALKKWLDEQPELPVVYVAFGTILDLSDAANDAMLTAFGRLPARVLWAFRPPPGSGVAARAAAPGGVPCNVRLESWTPQLHVLLHVSVRVFVSHAGFGSVTEAMYAGKPVVAIPGFGDQEHNAWRLQAAGAGLMLNKKDSPTLVHDLVDAVTKVLDDPSFAAAARRLAIMTRTAPGPAHAAALIESVAALGNTTHLMQPDNKVAVLVAATLLAAAVVAVPVMMGACCVAGFRVRVRQQRAGGERATSCSNLPWAAAAQRAAEGSQEPGE